MTEWLADWLAGVAVSCGMYRGLCQISKIEEHNKGRARAHVLCTICNKTTKGYNDDAPKERRKRRRGKNGFLCFFHFFFKIHASDPVFFLRLLPSKYFFPQVISQLQIGFIPSMPPSSVKSWWRQHCGITQNKKPAIQRIIVLHFGIFFYWKVHPIFNVFLACQKYTWN